jgi:hypothetical protein
MVLPGIFNESALLMGHAVDVVGEIRCQEVTMYMTAKIFPSTRNTPILGWDEARVHEGESASHHNVRDIQEAHDDNPLDMQQDSHSPPNVLLEHARSVLLDIRWGEQ